MQSSRHDPKPRSAAAIALGELAIASCESAERPVRATGRAAVFRTIMVRALMTLCLLTFAAPAMAQVTVTVIEPVTAPLIDGGKVLYQRLAPDTPDGPERARISMRMRIANNGNSYVALQQVWIHGTRVDPLPSGWSWTIPPGGSVDFQNCACNTTSTFLGSNGALVIDAPVPFPSTFEVRVQLAGQTVTTSVPMEPMEAHENAGGPLQWLGKASDLRTNELWHATSNHPSAHQVFGLDTALRGWNGTQWADMWPGADATSPSSYRAYGIPVYAMASGAVCWALNDHEEWQSVPPNDLIESPESPTWKGFYPDDGFNAGGNQIFVENGDEVTAYAHLQRGSIPPELLVTGAQITKGQYLGKVGLSGGVSGVHTHIHVKNAPNAPNGNPANMNGCDNGAFRPMSFSGLGSLAESQATPSWSPSWWKFPTSASTPHVSALLQPSTQPPVYCATCTDSKQYIGVWRQGSTIDLRVKIAGWSAFTAKWADLSNDKFRLVKVSTFLENGVRQYVGRFTRRTGGYSLMGTTSLTALRNHRDAMVGQGNHLVDLTTYVENGVVNYIGVWLSASGQQEMTTPANWTGFIQQVEAARSRNLRLVDVETYQPPSGPRQFIGVLRQGYSGQAIISVTGWNAFTATDADLVNDGLRLTSIQSYPVGWSRQYIGVYGWGNDGSALASVNGYGRLVPMDETLARDGLRLIDVHVEQ